MTRWDVCWATVKFEDSGEEKRRPVLIINSSAAYILAFKMTHVERKNPLEYKLLNWKEVGLNEPTTVRLSKKLHFNSDDKLTYIGKLTKQDIDNIKKILNDHNIPLTEGKVKSIYTDMQEIGGKEAYELKLEDELRDLNEYRDWLDTQGIKEVRKGGQFDSIEELNTTKEETENRIDEINNKLAFVRR